MDTSSSGRGVRNVVRTPSPQQQQGLKGRVSSRTSPTGGGRSTPTATSSSAAAKRGGALAPPAAATGRRSPASSLSAASNGASHSLQTSTHSQSLKPSTRTPPQIQKSGQHKLTPSRCPPLIQTRIQCSIMILIFPLADPARVTGRRQQSRRWSRLLPLPLPKNVLNGRTRLRSAMLVWSQCCKSARGCTGPEPASVWAAAIDRDEENSLTSRPARELDTPLTVASTRADLFGWNNALQGQMRPQSRR